jgi:hypothetical protein
LCGAGWWAVATAIYGLLTVDARFVYDQVLRHKKGVQLSLGSRPRHVQLQKRVESTLYTRAPRAVQGSEQTGGRGGISP